MEYNKLCSFSFFRMFQNCEINSKFFPVNEKIESCIESRVNGNIMGDKSEAFYTKCLKEFPFSEFPNENLLVKILLG